MYEGTIKASIIAGRVGPTISSAMSGNAYKKGETIIFDEVVRANNHLWAKKGDEYILLASDKETFITYQQSGINVFSENSDGITSDQHENPTGYIPINVMEVIQKTREKTHAFLIEKQGETNDLKDQYVFWYSSQRKLNSDDVISLDKREATIARNEIYARHGKEFKTEWLQTYFENTSWYKKSEKYDYSDEMSNLSTLEKANVELLSGIENGFIKTEKIKPLVAGASTVQTGGSTDEDTYLLWYSSSQLLTWDDVSWLTDSDIKDRTLYLMQCEIYARHGRVFEDKSVQEYFESTSWYKPNSSYSESELTNLEKANARFLEEYRLGNITQNSGNFDTDKNAVDYLNSYGIVDVFFANASDGNNVYWDAEQGKFIYQGEALFEDGQTTRNINVNGVTYQFEIDNSQYKFGDTVTNGIGVTNTNSGEYMIIGPGGTIYDRTTDGIEQTKYQSVQKTYSTYDKETNQITVNLLTDGASSPLDAYSQEQLEDEQRQKELEALAYQQFVIYGSQVRQYVDTFETRSSDQAILKRSMRLFGCPYQFTRATDPRWQSVSPDVGRKFAENILNEAPLVTIIPGIPRYLGGKKAEVKNSTTLALMDAAHDNFEPLKALIGQNPSKYMRYYDFQARYTDYMKYVNILCRSAATFLEVIDPDTGDIVQLDDGAGNKVPLTRFDWRNYRSDKKNYSQLVSTVVDDLGTSLKNAGYNMIKKIKKTLKINSDGSVETEYDSTEAKMSEEELAVRMAETDTASADSQSTTETDSATTENDEDAVVTVKTITDEVDVFEAAMGIFNSFGSGTNVTYDEEGNAVETEFGKNQFVYQTTTDDSEELESTMEDLLTYQNYIQFMVDPDVSCTESISNSTTESQFKGLFDNISQQMKEIMFVSQSGGMDTSGLEGFVESSSDALSKLLDKSFSGGVSSMFSRIITVGGNVLRGENMIFPQIYQSSEYSKEYTFTVHLKAESGSKLSYYMDVVVPLMHLLALALPRQTTSNTYGSPFMVKMFCEGLFTCNLGMVTSMNINKSVSSESWTIEGLPNEIDVTMGVTDLYSDLTMSPQSEPALFLNNSSLIEYLATTCGLSLLTPQLGKKWELYVNAYSNAVRDIPQNIKYSVTETIGNAFQEFAALYK